MARWILVIFIALIILSALLPGLEKLGLGRLPGDARLTIFGRTLVLPFASTLLISALAWLLIKIL